MENQIEGRKLCVNHVNAMMNLNFDIEKYPLAVTLKSLHFFLARLQQMLFCKCCLLYTPMEAFLNIYRRMEQYVGEYDVNRVYKGTDIWI